MSIYIGIYIIEFILFFLGLTHLPNIYINDYIAYLGSINIIQSHYFVFIPSYIQLTLNNIFIYESCSLNSLIYYDLIF